MLLLEQAYVLFVLQDRELGLRELWEHSSSRQTELEAALNALHFVRRLSQLRADTAQVRKTLHTYKPIHT